MKRLFCLLFVLAAINYGQSNNIEPGKLIAKTKLVQEDVINIRLANLHGMRTRFALTYLDEDTTYYSQWMEGRNGFSANLNLDELADGKYLLSVKNN
jgi:hypothetical protein